MGSRMGRGAMFTDKLGVSATVSLLNVLNYTSFSKVKFGFHTDIRISSC